MAAALPFLGASLQAQTNDHLFRSWQWPPEVHSARQAGWAGAGVASLDEATAGELNPALLASLTKNQAYAGGLAYGAGQTGVGDHLDSRVALGTCGVAARVSRRFVLSLEVSEARALRLELAPVRLPDGSADAGWLRVTGFDLRGAVAFRLTPRLHVGARMVSSRLSLDADARHDPATGPSDLTVQASGTATNLGAGLGLAYQASGWLTLAVSSDTGMGWRFSRRAQNPALGVELDAGSPFEIRRPSLLRAGVSVAPSRRLRLLAQLDLVRWSEIPAGLVIAQGPRARDEYRLADALEPRLGAEASVPLRRTSLQVRGGVHVQGAGQLRFEGPDATETAVFQGAKTRLVASLGASLITERGWRLDVAGSVGGERPAFLVGIGLGF
ncbi:MAG TPA: hypothetical protein VJU18_10905 [Vicinamibacteria bacterium]|nr:hypothetical protein [Vicinamibacteria bacterium]